MPVNVFGKKSSSYDNVNKIDKSHFLQKPYLRTKYTESNIEEDIDVKKFVESNNLHCLQENSDAVCKSYVDSGLNDPSIIQNTAHVDFNDKNLDNVRFLVVKNFTCCSRTYWIKVLRRLSHFS